jgi:hypothetical protein
MRSYRKLQLARTSSSLFMLLVCSDRSLPTEYEARAWAVAHGYRIRDNRVPEVRDFYVIGQFLYLPQSGGRDATPNYRTPARAASDLAR